MAWQASGYIQRSRKIVDKVDSILKPTCPQSADHLRPVVSWDVGFVSPVVVVGAFRVGFFVAEWGSVACSVFCVLSLTVESELSYV